MSEYTEEEIAAMRDKGKALGIGNSHNMKPENLVKKIAEAEGNAPPETPPEAEVDMKAVMERLSALEDSNAAKDDQIAALEIKAASPYDRKDEGDGPGNPNIMLYQGKKHKQFHPADVKKALKDGWSKEPDESVIREKAKE